MKKATELLRELAKDPDRLAQMNKLFPKEGGGMLDFSYTASSSGKDTYSITSDWMKQARRTVCMVTCPVCGMEYDSMSGPCPVAHIPQMLETHTGNTTGGWKFVLGEYEATVNNVFLNGKAQDLSECDEEESMEEFITLLAARGKLNEEQLEKLREIVRAPGWDERFVLLLLVERLAEGSISYGMLGYKRKEED